MNTLKTKPGAHVGATQKLNENVHSPPQKEPISHSLDLGTKSAFGSEFKGFGRRDSAFEEEFLRVGFNVAKLAHAQGLGVRQFQRKFHEQFETCPRIMMKEVRMRLAYERLLSKSSIKEISGELGYRDPAHFCRAFCQFYGASPMQMRNELRKRTRKSAGCAGTTNRKEIISPSPMDTKLVINRRLFYVAVASVLYATALMKLVSAISSKRELLEAIDPLIRISARAVLMAASSMEAAVAAYLVFGARESLKVHSLLWLSGNVLIYRFWWVVLSPPGHCKCLGDFTDWVGIAPDTANRFLTAVAVVLFICSGLLLVQGRWRRHGHRVQLSQPKSVVEA